MTTRSRWLALPLLVVLAPGAAASLAAEIPLAEHPQPAFERPDWLNLNGTWRFRFDPDDRGMREAWQRQLTGFDREITVPFPWGSPASGIGDEADIGWYARELAIPEDWGARRVFLNVGASDWHTTAWLDGEPLGEHRGGYTPFAFELTTRVVPGGKQLLVLRVDDAPRPFKLEGKQGYGNARGLWQTPYLEARGSAPLEALHFTPDVANQRVLVTAALLEPAPQPLTLHLEFSSGDVATATHGIAAGASEARFEVPIPSQRLWTLDDPFLYEVSARLESPGGVPDVVRAYFGMREISVVDLPGSDIPYIALNGKPVYLQLALDQAYHPEGYYTFPSDAFVRDEVLRARQIGLNGLRVHVKVPLPRKLYWADRLGMLIMADVPNSWGEPNAEMRQEIEHTLRGMIRRDYNHPSIFSWVPFNETWGLYTNLPAAEGEEPKREYRRETQEWVTQVVALAKQLDSTRLVEDNSVCCGIGHTLTDINSWHSYLPGWAWQETLDEISAQTFPGSTWNFEAGYRQAREPNINSEFGNVWGYEGSTGDVDWSWDYHLAVDAFRRHPKVAGWLYTEHHDVVNEWNGYWRFDRSEKQTGLGALVPGMTLRDLHAPLYVAVGTPGELCTEVAAGARVEVPLWVSFLTDDDTPAAGLRLEARLHGWDVLGREHEWWAGSRELAYAPWSSHALEPLSVSMPETPGLAILSVALVDAHGGVRQRNFTTFVVEGPTPREVALADTRRARLLSFGPGDFQAAEWSLRQWNVLDGLKVNGAGHGHFSYQVAWPDDVDADGVAGATLFVEASAKQLFGKDREGADGIEGDFMRGRGTHDPSLNPNAYPMTDEGRFPSAVTVSLNGVVAGRYELDDDPADHRGILSWHAQLRDRRLREAGSYGQRLVVPLPRAALERAARAGQLEIRFEVDAALPGGLALYGRRFGRYPLDPTIVLSLGE